MSQLDQEGAIEAAEVIEGGETKPENKVVSDFKHLHDTRKSLQKARIAVGNRVDAIVRGVDEQEEPAPEIYSKVAAVLQGAEEEVEKEMEKMLKLFPVWDFWLRHIKGIGPGLACQLLAITSHLSPVENPQRGVSIWYKAYGLIPQEVEDKDGNFIMRLPRPTKGEKLSYHPQARTMLFNIGESFVRTGAGGYYRDVYDKAKNTLQHQHKDDKTNWPPIRIERVSRWMAVKRFLSHLWEKWLESEGMEARAPYAVEKLGHSYQAPPEPKKDKGGKVVKI